MTENAQRSHFERPGLDSDGLCVECGHQPDTCDCAERLADAYADDYRNPEGGRFSREGGWL